VESPLSPDTNWATMFFFPPSATAAASAAAAAPALVPIPTDFFSAILIQSTRCEPVIPEGEEKEKERNNKATWPSSIVLVVVVVVVVPNSFEAKHGEER